MAWPEVRGGGRPPRDCRSEEEGRERRRVQPNIGHRALHRISTIDSTLHGTLMTMLVVVVMFMVFRVMGTEAAIIVTHTFQLREKNLRRYIRAKKMARVSSK